MKRHLKLRYLFIGLFWLMAMTSFAIIGWSGLIMNARLQEVGWIDKANLLADLTLLAAADSGRERGITAVLLASPAAGADGNLRAEMQQVRVQGDRLYQAVIEQLAVLHRVDELGTMREVYAQFQQRRRQLELAREGIDQALAGAGAGAGADADDLGSDVAWQEVMNDYIAGLGSLRRVALGSRREADHPFTENPLVKEILYTLIEYAGRERVLVGTVIARGRSFTTSELSEVQNYSAIVAEAIRKVDQMFTRNSPDEGSVIRDRVRQEYQGRIAGLRDSIYLASERGEAYPLSADEWFHEASSGINAIIALSDWFSAHARGDIALVQYEARGNFAVLALVGVMVLFSLMVAVFFIYRRALAPLRHLEQAAHSIAEGDLTQQISILEW